MPTLDPAAVAPPAAATPDAATPDETAGGHVIELQRVLNTPDFLPGCWLTEGAEAADAVALVSTPEVEGTGFLVSPWLLLTNNHVLPDPEHAARASVLFRYVTDDLDRVTHPCRLRPDPQRYFVTSPVEELDYTLVALTPMADGRAPGAEFGAIPLCGATRPIERGDPVNIIQHRGGRPREIAIRNNRLLEIDHPRYLDYEADSDRGSSGSPVLNDNWELVALHSRSDFRRDPGNPSAALVWVANRGIRISAIAADIRARNRGHRGDPAVLVAELLAFREHPAA